MDSPPRFIDDTCRIAIRSCWSTGCSRSFRGESDARAQERQHVNEPFFHRALPGHHPVMPGVLVIEAMAQTAAILSFKTMGVKPDGVSVYYFVGIDNARFKKPVGPGDQLIIDVRIETTKRGIWKYSATAKVDGKVAAEADLMCAMRSTSA
jgi:3-hydroxyacyl-[acyl-carrier-protein] dehydratase